MELSITSAPLLRTDPSRLLVAASAQGMHQYPLWISVRTSLAIVTARDMALCPGNRVTR